MDTSQSSRLGKKQRAVADSPRTHDAMLPGSGADGVSSADTQRTVQTHPAASSSTFRRPLTSAGTGSPKLSGCTCNTLFLKRDGGCTGILLYSSHIFICLTILFLGEKKKKARVSWSKGDRGCSLS